MYTITGFFYPSDQKPYDGSCGCTRTFTFTYEEMFELLSAGKNCARGNVEVESMRRKAAAVRCSLPHSDY